jgi:hypothetical protein
VGTQKHIISYKGENIMARVGGGYENFTEFVANNHRFFERTLLVHMIKSKESLEWVCEQLINDKKIQLSKPYQDSLNNGFKTSADDLVINRRLGRTQRLDDTMVRRVSPTRGSPSRSPTRKSNIYEKNLIE